MKYQRLENKVFVRIDKGEEVVDSLKKVCTQLDISLGTIIGIGAANQLTIGLLNTRTHHYDSQEFTGDHEIIPLCGNITTMNGEVYLHLHVNVCNAAHQSFGGHLSKAVVSVTCEAVIDVIEGTVNRVVDTRLGVNLLDL
ncbi:MAG: DNA-binding protein [Candidatus Thermoplasmatota archaeon]|nr:DNA-binding protein [Candidatus Thermoplasmatota archaeon]